MLYADVEDMRKDRGGRLQPIRAAARILVGILLVLFAATRAATFGGLFVARDGAIPAVGSVDAEASRGAVLPEAEVERRLEDEEALTWTCNGAGLGLPIKGVRYVPHLVGEPYPHPESGPIGYYTKVYSGMHERDLPLIGKQLRADVLSLRPWSTDGPEGDRDAFFNEMRRAGICKVIPSFHVAKYYADMLRADEEQPRTDPSSAFAVHFERFGASVQPQALGGAEMVAWSVDLSLDLNKLLPLVGADCEYSTVPEDKSFKKYMMLMSALQQWVHSPRSSVAPSLTQVPLLVPLDVSRVPWTEPFFQKKLDVFLKCMSLNQAEGGWSPLFSTAGLSSSARSTRWFLSFGEPMEQLHRYNFREQLGNVSKAISLHREAGVRAVVMVGTQALKHGGDNPINSVNLAEDFSADSSRYISPYDDYEAVNSETQILDGFIYDEWMDDWDRGARGPFFLAAEDIDEMKDKCIGGSRFTHDIDSCSRIVGNSGLMYPEFFGLAAASSQLWRHCVRPRFGTGLGFSRGGASGDTEELPLDGTLRCASMAPSTMALRVAMALLAFCATAQLARLLAKWLLWDREPSDAAATRASAGHGGNNSNGVGNGAKSEGELRVGYVTICPREPGLAGDHKIELATTRLRTNEEAGWWLWTHVSAQMAILERQVKMEVDATHALRDRRGQRPAGKLKAMMQKQDSAKRSPGGRELQSEESNELSSEASTLEDLPMAMQVVHRRTLEGFAAWCSYVSAGSGCLRCSGKRVKVEELRMFARQIEENSERPAPRLFAEALLLRVMESAGEQILQCPERLAYLLFNIFREAGGLEDIGPTTFSIDMDRLHDGLLQMNIHTNPYMRKKMPNGKWELGLNFDDINESGIQCRESVGKTYKEPASLMVVIDFILCYRVAIMLKLYTFAISGYIYLGSGQGDDISTTHNGVLWSPKWLRINYIQYVAMADAGMWVGLELLTVVYTLWQRWPSLGHRSPGIPGIKWFVEHVFNLFASVSGGLYVFANRDFIRKPWECAHSDIGQCEDDRSARLFDTLHIALIYWVCRVVVFCLMHGKTAPIFLYGTPDSRTRTEAGRGWFATWQRDMRVNLAWLAMLSICVGIEVTWLLPTMKGLDWSTTCGMDLLGGITGLPGQHGVCSEPDQSLAFGCITCLSSVVVGWALVFLGSFVDIYFVFYLASAVVGSVMGHRRELNDLKNTSLPIDLREHHGREAKLFQKLFGPGWQQIWRVMVRGLYQESLISEKQAISLAQAAGVSLEGEVPLTHRDKKQKPIHLTRFPALASERLAFFFQSLKWLDKQGAGGFEPATDALTGVHFDIGSVPSLTQIIPAYNEVVVPSVEFLRSGAEPEDARNSSPDDQPGLGDLTVPPSGDGVNSNLAFMISQFPDEWVFLAKRLHTEGLTENAESQDLYQSFMRQRLNEVSIIEVRFWTAMRMQSVAKTVIGALQYGRALASLPKVREHYRQFPEKRVPEDHAEVILAHQTYGHPEGIEKNDEAVRLLLQRYADDPVFLVFDLKKGSKPELWRLAEDFLVARGGYGSGAFEQASVKCRWDRARNNLRVLEVLPRKFALRLGQGEYRTQGKACNQLNGLRFASGHYVQALDCNMGSFIGEAFKVPYVLRMFMPLDKDDRSAPRCRYLGFREYIYTGREGTVGKCHAAAEWTFGTINQRFLSGMGMRMHYGHPDFLDGFWARNRGGMSKSSPVVNLSEDIFAGYNVRMREEASPHIDALEFEKGREATFNAASNFFSKISGGSISVIRSRDNHLLCERIGLLHSLSFYFTSVAFYTSNLLVDITIYLYVALFILFNLAGLGPGELSALGSTFSTEWLVSMGLVTLVPQLCEMVLEHGAMHAIKQVFGGIPAATFFFIFQNKNIASSMRDGAMTGVARYFFTGRPSANQHQTWRDIYATYWKSHYQPAISLATGYFIYHVLAMQNGQGKLPMVLVVISFIAWIITPIVFSPLSRWNLIFQDLREFNGFITGGAGKDEADLPDVLARGKKGTVRSLYECGLADELSKWSEHHLTMLVLRASLKVVMGLFIFAILPAEVLDYLPVFVVVLSASWVIILGYFAAGLNNVFLVMSFLVWLVALPFAHKIVGDRFYFPDMQTRMPEYMLSITVFTFTLSLAKEWLIIFCRITLRLCPCLPEATATRRLHECIRLCFVYFFAHQLQTLEAYFVLCANLVTASFFAVVDQVFCNAHTWFLLNRELARTPHGERYMEKSATFFELDGHRFDGSDLWSSDSDSEPGLAPGGGDGSLGGARSWA